MRIEYIVMHHSLTPRDLPLIKSVSSFNRSHKARLHRTRNSLWYHIAYHYIIWWDGEHIQTRGEHEPWRHASNRYVNEHSIGICLTGNFDREKPTEEQYIKSRKLIKKIKTKRPSAKVVGHNKFARKSCPGKNFNFKKLVEMFYKGLREKHVGDKIGIEDRTFKYPDKFLDKVKDLSQEEQMEELAYLMWFLFEVAKWNVK